MRMLLVSLALLCAVPAIVPAQGAPDEVLPERRVILEPETDFYGADLNQYFDTGFDACRAACLADAQCRAFTFNERSKSCFTKSEIRDRVAFAGATSGVVRDVPADLRAEAAARAETLDWLRPADLDAAGALMRELPAVYPSRGLTAIELMQSSRAARAQGNIGAARDFTGEALVLGDTADLWTRFGALSLLAAEDAGAGAGDLRGEALSAAINGYLRAGSPAAQAEALSIMAEALQRLRRGEASIPALRRAVDLAPGDTLAARLDAALGRYGFRVTDTRAESDAAAPRICATFSQDLEEVGRDYAPFVQGLTAGLAVAAEGRDLCISGVTHGERYRIALREGLPSAQGDRLAETVPLDLYVRDRAPAVRFPGRGYVLPAGGEVAVPVATVNAETVDLQLWQVSDRNVVRTLAEDIFGAQVPQWRQDQLESEIAVKVWEGEGAVSGSLNVETVTRLPLERETGALGPGIYVLQARIPGADAWESPAASQWFMVSDLGLATIAGADGLHGFVRSLSTAEAREGIALTLLSRANAVLGTAVTDASGHAVFPAGLARGEGSAAPALLVAREGDADMAVLPLTGPAFDLSDRGVEGRAPAGPLDVFLALERDIYRPGETVTATALLRDDRAAAVTGVPLTAILTRPDGVEHDRAVSLDGRAGGHVFRLPLTAGAARGTWRLAIHAETDEPPLAAAALLVEDFLPERIDVDLDLPEGPLAPDAMPRLAVEARYLFGAPAGGLSVEGRVSAAPLRTLEIAPGYLFGPEEAADRSDTTLFGPVETDDAGRAETVLALPEGMPSGAPSEIAVDVSVLENSGRPVERRVTRTVLPEGPVLGIRPAFDGTLPENSEAAFDVIALGARGDVPARWRLDRITTRYQWYSLDGSWDWDSVTSRERIAGGDLRLGADPVAIATPVEWGDYALTLEATDGSGAVSSVRFEAGWYAPEGLTDTPDLLELSLDAERYRPGDTARLRLLPSAAGHVLVTVASDRLIDMKTVRVDAGETVIDLPVTESWGPGAYVTATLFRPAGEGQGPARALGLAHAAIAPGDAALGVGIDAPETARPRAPLEIELNVEGIADGDAAFATVAAVDLGVLNLTGFEAPDPQAHYFGQRELGVAFRDLYGRLIDGRSGAMGQVRSGGDAAAGIRVGAAPPDAVVAMTEGPVEIGPDGTARLAFDLPAFDGTLRLMAVVWSRKGVGQAKADVTVRDPVVAQVTMPRFLAPGDSSTLRIELTHADGPAGEIGLTLAAEGLVPGDDLPARVTLEPGGTRTLSVPITAQGPGEAQVTLEVTAPDGAVLSQTRTLPVRLLDPAIQRSSRFELAPGADLTLSSDVFEGLRDGTATLAAGPFGRFDVPGLLAALDRYPYGCTEQVTSQALPLLYLSSVATTLGLEGARDIDARLTDAVAAVLARQAANGAFGMWRAESGELWLDAYVTDFLSRARDAGVAVPPEAFARALDNLSNAVNYAADFDSGGRDIAYALLVLAREGRAQVGDLRYYAEEKGRAFDTAMARAQIGAALALYGETTRADEMFRLASELVGDPAPEGWRDDFGSPLRDRAGLLTLAVEARSDTVDREALAASLVTDAALSTQEAAWSLLAANALIADPAAGLVVDGAPLEEPVLRIEAGALESGPLTLGLAGDRAETLTLTAFGVPLVPRAAGGEGFAIERAYFTLDGEPADPTEVAAGDRLVTVLTVQPFGPVEARLMVDDPLPAGFEIDNPSLLRSGEVGALDWLDLTDATAMTEFRDDSFRAAVEWRSDEAFRLAYVVRAITPGLYRHPAALVEDMYRPRYRAWTDTGAVRVAE
ncbi:alpha-2-macroglobulin family protein [Palleronia sediminis]|uniref:Alpha-2-macroglobulin family protein n=1 Tax=Palleronia sediminis TaxID=2547833 RepID=A0A4R6A6W3_9RHOB|nr:alpha-2-macroglobulin family protein [Palleronia sediminis]TDL78464.1 alpha-2-macroglobulin family protein [Palleronia sediminis]